MCIYRYYSLKGKFHCYTYVRYADCLAQKISMSLLCSQINKVLKNSNDDFERLHLKMDIKTERDFFVYHPYLASILKIIHGLLIAAQNNPVFY